MHEEEIRLSNPVRTRAYLFLLLEEGLHEIKVEVICNNGHHETDLFLCSQIINLQCMTSSVYDPGREDTIIVENFMEELCRRDNEVNRGENRDPNRPLKIF